MLNCLSPMPCLTRTTCTCVNSYYYPVDISTTVFSYSRAVQYHTILHGTGVIAWVLLHRPQGYAVSWETSCTDAHLGLHRQLNLSNQKMEAEDLFSLSMDDWLLSEEEEETTKLLNKEEIRQLVKKKKPRNTARKTESDLNVWYRWCLTVGEKRKLEDIPAH